MRNCLRTKISHFSPKLLTFITIFMMICAGARAETYYWVGGADNNWTTAANWNTAVDETGTSAVPGTGDTVQLSGNENITLTDDVTIQNLFIFSGTNSSTLDLGGKTLTVSSRIRLGQTVTGNLILTNGTVTTAEFDTEDHGNNSLTLNNISFSVTSKLLVNGDGTTTVSGVLGTTNTFNIGDSVTFYGDSADVITFGSDVTVNSGVTVWTGKNDSSWSDSANWAFGVPAADSSVIIAKVTTPPDLTAATNELKEITIAAEAKLTISSGGTLKAKTITNNGELTFKGGSISGTTSTPTPTLANGDGSSIVYDGATSPEWGNSYKKLQIKTGSNISFTTGTAVSIDGDFLNEGTVSFEKSATVTGNFTNTGSVAISTGKSLSLKGDVSSTQDINANGTIILNGSSAKAFSGGGKKYSNVETSNSITITGNNEFVNLTVNNAGGKTIDFGGTTQTVTGALTLKGTSENKLTLTGSDWELNCTGTYDIQYAEIDHSTATTPLIAKNSTDAGNNVNWNFPGTTYTWISDSDTDWFTAANWDKGSIPGIGAEVLIDDTSASPTLTTTGGGVTLSDATYTGKITIAAGATFDIADQDVDLGTGQFINNGRLRLKGTSGQAITAAMSNGTASTVEYHGTGNLEKFVWDGGSAAGKQYVNLKISLALPSTSSAASEQLAVSGTTTINAGTGKAVVLSNTSNQFSGDVIAGSTETPAFIAGAVLLKAASSITIADKANADSLDIDCAVIKIQNVTTSGDQTYSGVVTVSGTTTLKAPASKTIKFNGTVTGASSASLTIADPAGGSTAAKTVFTGNVFGLVSLSTKNVEISSASNISISTSGAQVYDGTVSLGAPQVSISASATSGTTFKGAVTEASGSTTVLSITGPLTIDANCSEITTTGNQTYAGAVSVAGTTASEPTISSSGGKLTFSNSLTLAQNLTLSATDGTNGGIEFTDATKNVSGNKILTISSGTKPITFDCTAGTTAAPLGQLVITGTTGPLTFNKGGYLGSNFSYTNGEIDLTGTLTVTGSFETGNIIATGTSNILTSGNQIYNGTVSGGADLTLYSNYPSGTGTITFNGDVDGTTALTTLETVGAVNIDTSCTAITTSGNQIYNDTVTILGSATSDPAITSTSGNITFKDSLTLNKDLSLTATNGGISFTAETDASANVFGAHTLTISAGSQSVTFNATAGTSAAQLGGLTLDSCTGTVSFNAGGYTGSALTHTDGPTKISGAFNATSVTTNALTVSGTTTTIDTGTGTQSYGTINGTAGTEALELTASSVTFGGIIGGITKLTSLTVNGASVINCASITANTVTFKGNVSSTAPDPNPQINGDLILGSSAAGVSTGITAGIPLTATSNVTFIGANQIASLTATGLANKTITFEAGKTQIVNGKLTLSGTANADGSRLILKSSTPGSEWTILCQGDNIHEITNVDVKDSYNNSSYSGSSYTLFAEASKDNGHNTNWAFPGHTYNWVGGDSTAPYDPHDWKNAKNWSPASIPGKGTIIIIPDTITDTNCPILKTGDNIDIDNGDATADNGTITVNGILNLAEFSVKAKKITNNGLLKLEGASSQNLTRTDGTTAMGMVNGNTSTVEYHGTGNLEKFVWDGGSAAGKQYVNLKISLALPSTSSAASEQLAVSGTTTINAGTGKAVVLSNTSNLFSGDVIAGSTETPAFIAGAVSLKAASSITIADKANADSLDIDCAVIKIQNVTTSGDQTYSGAVTVSGTTTLKAPAAKTIQFNGTVTGASSASLTIADPAGASTAAKTVFTGNVSELVSLSTKNVEISSASNISISTSGAQVYDGTVSLGAPQVSISASATSGTTFKGAVTEASGSTTVLSITGPLTIDANCSAITTTGNQTYAGAVSIAGTTASEPTISSSGGKLTFSNSLTLAQNLTLSATDGTNGGVYFTDATGNVSSTSNTLTISSGTKPITFSGTAGTSTAKLYHLVITGTTGSLTFAKGGYLGSNLSYTNGEIDLTGTLTVTGSFETGNIIATGTSYILTSGNQIYNGTVSGGADLTLNSNYPSGTGTISFNGDVNGTTPLTKLQTTGEVTINCENVVTTGTQTYNNAVTLGTGTPVSRKLNGSSLTFNSTINGEKKLELTTTDTAGTILKGIIGGTTPPASITVTGPIFINTGCTAITTSGTQLYKGDATINEDSSFTGGGITFASTSTVSGPKTLTVAAGTNAVTFDGHAGSSTTSTLHALVITSADSTTFENAVYIGSLSDASAHTGAITFKKDGNITTIGTGTNGTINTTGTVTIGQSGSTATLTVGSNFTHTGTTTDSETVIYGSLSAANKDISLGVTSGGPITLIGRNITLNQNLTSGNTLTVTNSGLFKTADGKAVSFNGASSTETGFTQNNTGNTMLGGSLTGTGKANFARHVYIYGSGAAAFGASGNSINIASNYNLIVCRSGGALSINADSVSANNIVFYKGSVNLNGNLYSVKDIVILGGTLYSTEDSSTGFTNEYAYDATRPSGWSTALYTFESQFPDTTAISRGDTSFTVASGKIIHSGKNFYANGTTLSGTAEWFIDILSNANSTTCFAEAYNSTISNCTVRLHNGTTAAGTPTPESAQIPAETCTLNGCTNFDSTAFTITDTWTTRDNVVYVKFNRAVRNLHGELNDAVSNFKYFNSSDIDTSYAGIYTDEAGLSALEDGTEPEIIYLKSNNYWNTDATGANEGNAISTDRYGTHHDSAKPYVDIPRALGSGETATQSTVITDRFGKRLTHYSGAASRITTVLDKTGPVLIQVRTGQETHNTTLADQEAYDAHNFVEFIYSEAVNFGPSANATDASKMNTADWIPAYQTGVSGTANTPQNIQVASSLGYVNNLGGLTFTGLNQTIASGEIHTRQAGTDSQDVNAFYRQSTHSIKYSLAGYANNVGTANVSWAGYIESAEIPSGSVTGSATAASPNPNVTDCAVALDGTTPLYNQQIMNRPSLSVTPVLSEPANTIYGSWDTLAPVFVKGHIKGDDDDAPYFEAIGNGNGSTLTKVEIHIADNPSSSTSPNGIWLTRYGWANSTDPSTSLSAAADNLVGGARPYATSNKTSGGLRYCTIVGQENAFSYAVGTASSTNRSFTAIAPGAAAPFFTSSTSNRNEIPTTQDNTYINLTLSDTNLPYKSTFTISYNESGSYITDLAGNRLRSQPLMNSIDRTSPDFKISFSPVNSNKLLLIFVKALSTQIKYNQNEIPESFETIIPYCFEIGTISSGSFSANTSGTTSTLQIDTATPARILRDKSNSLYTVIELTLNQNTTLEDLKNLYIRLKNAGTVGSNTYNATSRDPLTGIDNSYVSFIQDTIGNYMQMYQAHALSDFAAGIINPLYAYNDGLEYDEENITQNLYEAGSWAVHDWNAEQNNYGTLIASKAVTVVSSVDTTNLPVTGTGAPDFSLRLYYTVAPSQGSQSSKFNSDLPANQLRLWMPDIAGFYNNGLFPAYAAIPNANYGYTDGTPLNATDISKGFQFNISQAAVQSFTSGNQATFLFGIFDGSGTQESICLSPILDFSTGTASYATTDRVPLYLIRLKNPSDITSLDLWSFKLKDIKNQRGGVTILNNVIDAGKGEKTVVKVDLPQEGRVNVIVMTLDGNIITYLNRGNIKAGEHYFTWNGKNKNGKPVARGMYFVRVTGSGIDETRKVMVVK